MMVLLLLYDVSLARDIIVEPRSNPIWKKKRSTLIYLCRKQETMQDRTPAQFQCYIFASFLTSGD